MFDGKLFSRLAFVILGLTLFIFTLPVSAVDSYSPYTTNPPTIDGIISPSEWGDACMITLPHGYLFTKHDSNYLYILLDLVGDTLDDPPSNTPPYGDFFWLSFDVNTDSSITSNVDINYGTYPDTWDLGKQYYLGPSSWTGLKSTTSQLGVGFGSSPMSATSHRIWELAIDLTEVSASHGDLVRIGLKMHSDNPNFTDDVPTGFTSDFSDLVEILLRAPPVGGKIIQTNPAIITPLLGLVCLILTTVLTVYGEKVS